MSRSMPFAERLHGLWRWLAQTGRLLFGMPDYDLYLAHMRRRHPERTPMTREAFFADRLQARYARGTSRCC